MTKHNVFWIKANDELCSKFVIMSNNELKIPKIGLMQNLMHLGSIVHNPALHFKKVLDDNNGLVQLSLPYGTVCMTDRPEFIRHVLQKNHKNYIKTAFVRGPMRNQIGNGLLTSDGEYWFQQRRAIQPGFHKQRLEGISKIMVEEINQYMDTVLDPYADTDQEIDLAKEMSRLAFKIVSKGLFGEAVDDSKLDIIDEIVTKSQQFIVDQIRKPFLKPWHYLSGAYERNRKLKEKGDNLILEIIKERQLTEMKHDDLLDMLLETKYEDGSGMTNQQLLDEAIILYVAGHETSAVAMSWAWYLIATHPEIEGKLLKSVFSSIGDKDPSFEDLRKLEYSRQVVEETMRLYPPAWLIDREPLADDKVEGIPIKKSQDVLCLIYGVHHNSKYWTNPEKFDPDRFTTENKKGHVPFSYMPFGGGPRLCIGNSFALMEMQFVLAMLIRRFQFELVPEQLIDINPLVTLRPRHGIKVLVKKR